MRSAISCHLFLYYDLVEDKIIDLVHSSGFRAVELWAMQPHFPYRDTGKIDKIVGTMHKTGVSAVTSHLPLYEQVHAPGKRGLLLTPSTTDEEVRLKWLDETKAAVAASSKAGARVMTLHTDLDFSNPDEGRTAAFRKSMDELVSNVLPEGCIIAVENMVGGPAQVSGLVEAIEDYPRDKVGITLDIGHAHITGDLLQAVRETASRLASIHAHDNDGTSDDHLLPGQGDMPWDSFKKALKDIDFDGPLVWEIRDPTAGDDPGLKIKSEMLKELKRFDEKFARP